MRASRCGPSTYFRSRQDVVSPLLADVRRPVAGTAGGGRARGRPVPGAAEAIRIAPETWAPRRPASGAKAPRPTRPSAVRADSRA
ncbi:hypothetical protein ACE1SV_60380 [Streptomyces sp. E-15]